MKMTTQKPNNAILQRLNASSASAFDNCSFIPGIRPLESPGVTPIKPLPFSPSQFLNSPSMNLPFDNKIPASTPVHKYSKHKVSKHSNIASICQSNYIRPSNICHIYYKYNEIPLFIRHLFIHVSFIDLLI